MTLSFLAVNSIKPQDPEGTSELSMGMYWEDIALFKAETLAEGNPLVANRAPASIPCIFTYPDQNNLGCLFLIEFL